MNGKRIDPERRIPIRVAVAAIGAAFSIAAMAQPAAPAQGFEDWSAHGIVVVVTAAVVCICVLLHYECLTLLSRWMFRFEGRRRRRVLVAIFGMLAAHIVEIWIFGVAYYLLLRSPAMGAVHDLGGGLLDRVYISAMTFTTVGAPDNYMTGPIRFVSGTEALTGLVLITWSASFTFLEMERFWRNSSRHGGRNV
jgi:hypothetical protein